MSVDDWSGDKGQQLRNHADHLTSSYSQTRFPSDLAYLLAYPMAESCSGIDDWYQTWASAFYLRELTEFGTEHESHESRSKTSELLFFLWQVGFALFDTKAQYCDAADSDSARTLVLLFQQLNSALQEMLLIVNTLNRDKWQLMPELLALRRLLWQETPNTHQQSYQVFLEQDKPRFSDYLESLKHQELELIQLLGSALRNNVDVKVIVEQIKQSGICVDNIISTAEKLNQISAKHYPLRKNTLLYLHQLMDSK